MLLLIDPAPQWSPVISTGRTIRAGDIGSGATQAAMEPGHIDREDRYASADLPDARNGAAMEPGHIDREDTYVERCGMPMCEPQWSPVISTGRTKFYTYAGIGLTYAAMEPGHIDREDTAEAIDSLPVPVAPQWSPVISTGRTG